MPSFLIRIFSALALMLFVNACSTQSIRGTAGLVGKGQLELNLTNFRNSNGVALVYIYSGPQGFPDKDAPNLIRIHQPIQDKQAHLILEKLPYYSYAIAVLHDENLNGLMDKSLLGFPREGFGFSRNPETLFGPADYEKAQFLFVTKHQKQTIELQYPKRRKLRPENAGSSARQLK